jgi:beta-phosphoglucomutase
MLLAAVIFDFDGVLADSEPLHLAGFHAALTPRGYDVPSGEYYAHFLGYNDEDALAAMSARYGWGFTAADIQTIARAKLAEMTRLLSRPEVLYPGAAACVRAFAEVLPLGIASGATRDEIELVLRAHDLTDAFDVIVASGETASSKPAPDPYARAVELLQASGVLAADPGVAGRCVAVEDSRWGILSAKAAGLRCVGLTTSYQADELREADLVVSRLSDLTVERLAGLVGDDS